MVEAGERRIWLRARRTTHGRSEFAPVWEASRPRLWGLCARLSGSADAADDLVQEVGIRALQSYPSFRGEADVHTWLFRITLHVVQRHRERQGKSVGQGVPLDESEVLQVAAPTTEQPERQLLDAERIPGIRRALDALPDDLRVPLILHIYEEMKCREIAALLEIPLGTVLSRLHTARQRLKAALEQEFGNEV